MATKRAEKPAKSEWRAASLEESLLHAKFTKMFEVWHDNQPHRTGVHVSSLIVSDKAYCARQIVLMQFFQHEKINMFGRTLQIFLQGWVMHRKWQDLFSSVGIDCSITPLSVEESRIRRGVTFTPDVVICVGKGKKRKDYIVEIKSMNREAYESLKGIHADARKQANMYMWLTGIERAIVLVENKDSQEFKLWVISYDPGLIRPYVKRAKRSAEDIELFQTTGRLPGRHVMCPNEATAKAQRCVVRGACFMGKLERRGLRNGRVSTADAEGG